MTARLYPRINPATVPEDAVEDPKTGTPTTPLIVPGGSFSPLATVDRSMADNASEADVTVVDPVFPDEATFPEAPGHVLPLWVEHNDDIHIRIAFIDPDTGAPASGVPPDLYVAVVPRSQILAAPGESLTLAVSANPLFSEMLRANVANPTPVNVRGGFAELVGGALTGTNSNIKPLAIQWQGNGNEQAGIDYDAVWYLVLRSDDAVCVTFTVTEDPADGPDVTLPWLHVPPSAKNLNLAGLFTPGVTTMGGTAGTVATVHNLGPGDLTIAASTTPDGSGDEVHVVETPIGAGETGSVGLDYTAADGVTDLPVLLDGDSEAMEQNYHNREIRVTVTTVGIADTVVVLDASGSMAQRPDGAGPGDPDAEEPVDRRRWDNLADAMNHFVDGYVSFLTDGDAVSPSSRLGVAVFPDVLDQTGDWRVRAGVLFPSAPVDTDNLAGDIGEAIETAGTAITPFGLTPLGNGIAAAMGADASPGMFHADVAIHRRWMVLMSDGEQNAGSIPPSRFYDGAADVPDFSSKQVRVFTIGYSTEGLPAANQLLQELATNGFEGVLANHEPASTGAGYEKDLTDSFLDAMAVTIDVPASDDPSGLLTPKSRLAIHEFRASPFDTGIGIFVDWRTRTTTRVQIALISPRCERFDEAELDKRPEFRLRKLPAYAHAYISRAALAGSDTTPSRYGTWKLEVRLEAREAATHATADGPAAQGSEPYQYRIFSRSGLRLKAEAAGRAHATGRPIELMAWLQLHGAPAGGARVVATIERPAGDAGTQLAGTVIEPEELERNLKAAEQKMPDIAGTWAVKALTIARKHGAVAVPRIRTDLVFKETSPGIYRATIPDTGNTGLYTAHIVATGQIGGEPYHRECSVSVNVQAVPSRDHTHTAYELLDDRELLVRVHLRDAVGNAVIFDPRLSPRLTIDVREAKAVSSVSNHFDGSYSQRFRLAGSGQPSVVLRYDGKVISPPEPIPDPRVLRWMKLVNEYRRGTLIRDVQHDDPKRALGPVKTSDDPFVAIGDGGHVVLGPAQRRFHASHIAVFTHRESDAPYEVLVRPAGMKIWLSLGVSDHATRVFEVPRRVGPIMGVLVRGPTRADRGELRLLGVGYTWTQRPPRPDPRRLSRGLVRR